MKRKSKKQADSLLSEVIEGAEDGDAIILKKGTYISNDEDISDVEIAGQTNKTDTHPLDTEAYVKFVTCVYSGPVNVTNAPSGKIYRFQPGQTKPVDNAEDYDYLLSLKRNSGPDCCGGANADPRHYFDVVSFDKEA